LEDQAGQALGERVVQVARDTLALGRDRQVLDACGIVAQLPVGGFEPARQQLRPFAGLGLPAVERDVDDDEERDRHDRGRPPGELGPAKTQAIGNKRQRDHVRGGADRRPKPPAKDPDDFAHQGHEHAEVQGDVRAQDRHPERQQALRHDIGPGQTRAELSKEHGPVQGQMQAKRQRKRAQAQRLV